MLLLTAHGGAMAVVATLVVSTWLAMTLFLVIGWSAWQTQGRLYSGTRIVRLLLRTDGKLEFTRLNGEAGESRAHPHTTVTSQLAILLLRLGRRIEPLVLLPDALSADDFRRLRLWLRWQAAVEAIPERNRVC